MAREINYSIIIPHKNIPELLQRCLASIPRRDDVQIIVVDDNSDLDKVDFDHFPGLGDPFVEVVFTKEGKGAGYARNVGLKKATGKWLLFADADDFYNYCINDILDEYVNSNADIIYFSFNSLDSATYNTTYRLNHFKAYIDYWFFSQDKAKTLLRYKHPSSCGKLIKYSLIEKNDILFDEVSISNDVTFAYLSGYYAEHIYADTRALYCTTVRQGSIRRSKMTLEKKLDAFYVYSKRYLFYKKKGIQISYEFGFINTLIKFYLSNRACYFKAMDMLFDLGYTIGGIFRLCVYNILIYIPQKIIVKLFPERRYLPFFDSKLRIFLNE